jgi:hypothetical protein
VHELAALSERSGCRVFCKRDDLTSFGFGGNKARKLDFLIAVALRSGCAPHMLGGREPDLPTGNLRLDHMLGATWYQL